MNTKKKPLNNAITFKLGINEINGSDNLSISTPPFSVSSPTSFSATNNVNFIILIKEKILYIQEIIQKTIISVSDNRKMDLFSNSEYIICISTLNELYEKSAIILDKIITHESHDLLEQIISELQPIVDKISNIISNFGTTSIIDLLFICFGTKYIN
jgi:predicted PurR-regulated permease PerM